MKSMQGETLLGKSSSGGHLVLIGAGTPVPPTTQAPTIVTIPNPASQTKAVGPTNGSDFWGLGLAVLAIIVVIVIVRTVFKTRTHPLDLPEERRPGAPPET